MFENRIKRIDQAEQYYRAMGCSHYHMAREYPERYSEYKALNITEDQELQWKIEKFNDDYKDLTTSNTEIPLWSLHSNMSELTETIKNESILVRMLEATQNIKDKVPTWDRIIVSETINGRKYRKYRSGLIYLSYDLKKYDIAKQFAELSLYFAEFIESESRDRERCNNSIKLCQEIVNELGLKRKKTLFEFIRRRR